jgi:hypothetical protein
VHEPIDDFLRRNWRLADPRFADNQCRIATDALTDELRALDIGATPIWVRCHRTPPADPSPRAMTADRHRLVRLPDGTFVDVTRRQFDPDADHPTYYGSEADLARHWRQIDRGPVDGAAHDEDWHDLDP